MAVSLHCSTKESTVKINKVNISKLYIKDVALQTRYLISESALRCLQRAWVPVWQATTNPGDPTRRKPCYDYFAGAWIQHTVNPLFLIFWCILQDFMALFYATRNTKALGRPMIAMSSLWRTKSFSYSSFNADLQVKLKSDAQTIFQASLSAVSPQEMVKNNLLFHQNILSIKEREYAVDKNVSVVAFGKAVLGMAKAVDDILRDQIVRGVASIPVGLPDVIKVGVD